MKSAKKVLSLAMGAALSFSMLAACSGGNSAATPTPAPAADPTPAPAPVETPAALPNFTTVEEGKLHMSTNAAFPPYEMIADGEGYNGTGFEGIDVEVAGAIAEKLGLELVVDDMDFNAALAAAQTGKSDMVMAGVTVTPDRQESMDFSTTYATGVQVIIVAEGTPIYTVEDLSKAGRIGVQEGTTGYIYCSAPIEEGGYGEEATVAYTNGAMAIQALLNGQVDAVVIDNQPAQEFVKNNPELYILDTEYANEDYAIGVQKGNTELLTAINQALAELEADGTLQSIVDKYIKAE